MVYLHVQYAEKDTSVGSTYQIGSTGFLEGADVQICEYMVTARGLLCYKFMCACFFLKNTVTASTFVYVHFSHFRMRMFLQIMHLC